MQQTDNQAWPFIAGISVLGVFIVLVALGPNEEQLPENPGADAAPGLSFTEPEPIPDKFRPLGAVAAEQFSAEPDKARPDLDVELPPEVAKSVRLVINPPKKVRVHPEKFRGTAFQSYFGGPGKQPGQFAYPRAMTTSPDGKLFIVDKSGRIQRFGANGDLEIVIRTPKIDRGKPTGLGMTKDQQILVADTHYARILTYDLELNLVTEFGTPGADPGKFMFVTDCEEAWTGEVFVTDYGDLVARVQVFSRDGKFQRTFGEFGSKPGQFQRPMAIAIDHKNKEIFVADAVNHRIQVFNIDGKLQRMIGQFGTEKGALKYPYDVSLDDGVGLWVAEFGNNRIQVLHRQTGQAIGKLGRPGRAIGQLAYPWAVTMLPENRVAVLDSGNDRVYICRRRRIIETGS